MVWRRELINGDSVLISHCRTTRWERKRQQCFTSLTQSVVNKEDNSISEAASHMRRTRIITIRSLLRHDSRRASKAIDGVLTLGVIPSRHTLRWILVCVLNSLIESDQIKSEAQLWVLSRPAMSSKLRPFAIGASFWTGLQTGDHDLKRTRGGVQNRLD